jgi:hypothetical protein
MKDADYKTITLVNGIKLQVDFSMNQMPCRKCKKLIRFGITNSGKYMPIIKVGDNWQTHFADCEFAKEFRKKKSKVDVALDEMEKERARFEIED